MDVLSITRDGIRATVALAHLGARAALLPARLAVGVAELAAEKVADALFPSEPASGRANPPAAGSAAPPRPGRRPAPVHGDRAPTPGVPLRRDTEPDAQRRNGSPPSHVDEEATLVLESADPGAADGVGAEIRVDPPWPGYARMTAAEVIDRIAAQPESVLTVLLLYERSHRARPSVIAASERALTRLAGR
jgi:hypothetical protein